MTVSWTRPLDATCPHCGRAFEAPVWVVVHAAERLDLVDQARQEGV